MLVMAVVAKPSHTHAPQQALTYRIQQVLRRVPVCATLTEPQFGACDIGTHNVGSVGVCQSRN
jgi:hypothetical protein